MTNNEAILRLELLKQLGDVRGKLGWYIYRNVKVLTEAVEEAVKIRNEALVKYGTKDDENTYSINPSAEGWAEYIKEVEPVMQIEQDIPLVMIKRDEFDALVSDTSLSASEMMVLDNLLVEGNK